MITLDCAAPEMYNSDQRFGQKIFIQAANGTFEYHYQGDLILQPRMINVDPRPGGEMWIPEGNPKLVFQYKRGHKV